MTNQQELELLAEWLGIKIDKSPYNGGGTGNTGFDICGNAVIDWHNGKVWNPSPTGNSDDFLKMVAGMVEIYWTCKSVEAYESDGEGQRVEFFADHPTKTAAMKHAAYQVCLMAAREWKGEQ